MGNSGSAHAGDVILAPIRVGRRLEYADEYRAVERCIGSKPFVDVAVATQAHLGLVSLRQLGGHVVPPDSV